MRGRNYAVPQDIYDVSRDVLRHRVLLSYEALADGVTAEDVVERVVTTVGAPRITPVQDTPASSSPVAEAS
jgi:MoxR-like ATPase